jgi:hypothetical protein
MSHLHVSNGTYPNQQCIMHLYDMVDHVNDHANNLDSRIYLQQVVSESNGYVSSKRRSNEPESIVLFVTVTEWGVRIGCTFQILSNTRISHIQETISKEKEH